MIRDQLVARGVCDERVLAAFHSVPRDLFVPPMHRAYAFIDSPLPLSHGQTISQPFIVARMTELLELSGRERVLELGTGSGYQTAVLAQLTCLVFSAELEPELSTAAAVRLATLGLRNVQLGVGDGVELFREQAPFDAILSAAAPRNMPERLLEQLAEGGRCVIPVGDEDAQYLWRVRRRHGELQRERLDAVRFVPLRAASDGRPHSAE